MWPTSTDTYLGAGKVVPLVAAVTVTVVLPSPSDTLAGLAVSVMSDVSSSVMVSLLLLTEVLGVVPNNVRSSSSSGRVSSMGVKVMVWVADLLPCGMVIRKGSTAS